MSFHHVFHGIIEAKGFKTLDFLIVGMVESVLILLLILLVKFNILYHIQSSSYDLY